MWKVTSCGDRSVATNALPVRISGTGSCFSPRQRRALPTGTRFPFTHQFGYRRSSLTAYPTAYFCLESNHRLPRLCSLLNRKTKRGHPRGTAWHAAPFATKRPAPSVPKKEETWDWRTSARSRHEWMDLVTSQTCRYRWALPQLQAVKASRSQSPPSMPRPYRRRY
jgi:hypothetical protein